MVEEIELTGNCFWIELKEACYGWQYISLHFGSTEIPFYASYMGLEPLTTLIDSVLELETDDDDYYEIRWSDEPGRLIITLEKFDSKLKIHIVETDADPFDSADGTIEKEWRFVMDYSAYREAIINYGLQQLKRYGLRGYNANWSDGWDRFPMNGLLILLGTKSRWIMDDDSYYSNIFEELKLLEQQLRDIEI